MQGEMITMSRFALNVPAKKNIERKRIDEANMIKSDNFSARQLVWGFLVSIFPVLGRFEIFHYKQLIGNFIHLAVCYPIQIFITHLIYF